MSPPLVEKVAQGTSMFARGVTTPGNTGPGLESAAAAVAEPAEEPAEVVAFFVAIHMLVNSQRRG